jgi:hypothetical protein
MGLEKKRNSASFIGFMASVDRETGKIMVGPPVIHGKRLLKFQKTIGTN